jgi:hypothetical protein
MPGFRWRYCRGFAGNRSATGVPPGDYHAFWGIFPAAPDRARETAVTLDPRLWHDPCSYRGMGIFFMRFIGALVLESSTYEDVEADRRSTMQSVVVVAAVCLAGGVAAMGPGFVSLPAFMTGAIVSLGAWLVWVSIIVTVGTVTFRERQTRSDLPELLRVLGFAAAPGVFIALAAMRAVAPFVLVVVALWMIAAAVIGVRQALDYRHTSRAVAVCVVSALVTSGLVFAVLMMFGTNVS